MKQLKRLAVALAFVSLPAMSALPDSSVSYTTVGEPLYVVIHNLEKTLGTKIVVRDVDTNQMIKGKYLAPSGKAFVAEFAERNKLAWAYQDGKVILAPIGTDLSPKPVVTGKEAAPSSFSRIVFDPKDSNKNGLMIFQIHNASVDDRKISGGKTVKGVATLFGEFIGAPTPQSKSGKQQAQTNVTKLPRNESSNVQNNILGLFTKTAPAPTGEAEDTPQAVFSGNGARGVYADSRMNAVLVRDKVSNFEAYKQIIALLDRPADMVQLEAFIVDVEKSKLDTLGINLGLGGTNVSNLILNPFNSRSLLSKIKALETTGSAESLSVPSVVSLNNEQALFSSRQNFYLEARGAYDASYSQVTAETQLLVTPQIANESADVPYNQRRVKLLINVQDAQANISEKSTTENQITTQAVVRSGDTLVIGGQIVRKKLATGEGLPGTTGEGFFGRIFSERTTSEQDYVRVYIVRPLILGEDSASAREVKADPVVESIPSSITQDVLNRAPFVSEINLLPKKAK